MTELPDIPGGWTTRDFVIANRNYRVTLPSSPDAFLDDPAVLAENQRNDYMPYWPYLWPASLPMAEAVACANWPASTEILEIGAGIGLVGLVALGTGHLVTFSDYRAEAVDLALFNTRQNGLSGASGEVLDWTNPPADQLFPVILGCDLLYERRNLAPILGLLDRMLSPRGVAWFGDAGRAHAEAFVDFARDAGYAIDIQNEQGERLAKPHVGRFQLITLTR